MTVLFADLVGFTSRAERLDPEDVRALLSPYYARRERSTQRCSPATRTVSSSQPRIWGLCWPGKGDTSKL